MYKSMEGGGFLRGKYQKRRRSGPLLPLFCVFIAAAAVSFTLAAAPAEIPVPAENPEAALPAPVLLYRPSPENGSPFPLLPPDEPQVPEPPQPALPAPDTDFGVRTVTHDGGPAGTVYLANESKYEPAVQTLLQSDRPVSLEGRGIEVLILHTHGTEAYTPSDGLTYTATEADRTLDPERSVIRVGTELQRVLESRGIGVVHSTALHDYPAYSGSYDRALTDIQSWVQQYPDIRIIIDLHRDSIVSSSGTKYKTAALIDSQSTAQLMFVAGTDGGGLQHPAWQTNLTLQLQLHEALNSRYPGLMRPMSIRNARFNQHVTRGSMLLEVGTSGNSLTEALNAVRLFGTVLADLLLEQ